ncbi:MAG: hypothetical protein ACOZBW_02400, partial [Thermodesulfobacteriota bacterium]
VSNPAEAGNDQAGTSGGGPVPDAPATTMGEDAGPGQETPANPISFDSQEPAPQSEPTLTGEEGLSNP